VRRRTQRSSSLYDRPRLPTPPQLRLSQQSAAAAIAAAMAAAASVAETPPERETALREELQRLGERRAALDGDIRVARQTLMQRQSDIEMMERALREIRGSMRA
jgi:hypothetical protein